MALPSISDVSQRLPARALWWAWAGACALAGLICAIALQRATSARAVLDEARNQAVQVASQGRQPDAGVADPPRDFIHLLPAEPARAAELATHLQAGCRGAGVTLASLTVAQHAATPSALGRVELEVELAGSYRDVKQVLAHWMTLGEWATVRSLQLRAEGGPAGTVQAHAVLAAWSQPAGAAAASGSTASSSRGR